MLIRHGDPLGVSPRDDLEGLTYVLAYIGKGELPWTRSHPFPYIEKSKATGDQILAGMDPLYKWLFNQSQTLEWGVVPDYDAIITKFSERWIEKGHGPDPGDFDWWVDDPQSDCYHASGSKDDLHLKRWCYGGWRVFIPERTDDLDEYEPALPLPSNVPLPDLTEEEILFFNPEKRRLPKPGAEERLYLRSGLGPLDIPLPLPDPEEAEVFGYMVSHTSDPELGVVPTFHGFKGMQYYDSDHMAAFYDLEEVGKQHYKGWPNLSESGMAWGTDWEMAWGMDPFGRPKPDAEELARIAEEIKEMFRKMDLPSRVALPKPDFVEYLWLFTDPSIVQRSGPFIHHLQSLS